MSRKCLICLVDIEGEPNKCIIDRPMGLGGVVSTVLLCDDHANVHPTFVRKRLEDSYSPRRKSNGDVVLCGTKTATMVNVNKE